MTRTVNTERPATKRPSSAGDGGGEPSRRLVVELNKRTAQDLAWLVEEEELNKTTIVNRALQVYKHVVELQARGGSVVLDDPAKGQQERMLIV